jgi:hypothetical protein
LDWTTRSPVSEVMLRIVGEVDIGGRDATGGLRGEGVVFEGEIEGEVEMEGEGRVVVGV